MPNTALVTLVLEGVLEGVHESVLPTELIRKLGWQGSGGDMRSHPGCSVPVAPGPEATLAATLPVGGANGIRGAMGGAIGGMNAGGSGR